MKRHWPIVPVLVVASLLLFTNLDQDYLWADEGDTAVLAGSILEFGLPTAWDGVTFTDSDFGERLNDDLVMVSHPWLQYYVTAASFALLGETTLAARLPFAIFGLATIVVVYLMLVGIVNNRWAAISASILLVLSVQFLIYSRQSRYYALTALLACLLVYQFLRLKSWAGTLRFAFLATLLFHSHPMGLAPMPGLGLLTLVYAPFRAQRPWFWRSVPFVAVLTLPWLFGGMGGYVDRLSPTLQIGTLFPRLAQFAIEAASVTSLAGAAVLWAVLRRRARAKADRPHRDDRARPTAVLTPDERSLAVALCGALVAYALAIAWTQSRETIWMAGLRYSAAVIPFAAILAGLFVAKASRGRWPLWLALMLVFGFTKLGRLTPWTFWEEPTPLRDQNAVVTFHNPERTVDRVLRTGHVGYVRSLFEPSRGTTARIADYLNAHAGPRDIVITNYAWEPIYFHTGLPQGMKVLPSYPIWRAAKDHGLPSYVFSAEGVRWVVWRRAWGAYRGQACEKILATLEGMGVPVTLVKDIPETMFENRENVHFRRFPGNRYLYPWFDDLPSTLIFRVDWPAGTG